MRIKYLRDESDMSIAINSRFGYLKINAKVIKFKILILTIESKIHLLCFLLEKKKYLLLHFIFIKSLYGK